MTTNVFDDLTVPVRHRAFAPPTADVERAPPEPVFPGREPEQGVGARLEFVVLLPWRGQDGVHIYLLLGVVWCAIWKEGLGERERDVVVVVVVAVVVGAGDCRTTSARARACDRPSRRMGGCGVRW